MKITLAEAFEALDALGQCARSKKLSARDAFRLAVIIQSIETHTKPAAATRNQLFEEMSQEVKTGVVDAKTREEKIERRIPKDKQTEFTRQMEELFAEEIEVKPLPWEVAKNLEIDGLEAKALLPILTGYDDAV